MASDTIKFSRTTMIIAIALLIVLAIGLVYYFKILPSQQKQAEIKEYKKSLYESILCQYNCPLQNYTVNNQTQAIQKKECVVECINMLKQKGYIRDQYSNNEINNDNLAKDIEGVITNCRSAGAEETEVPSVEAVTECSITGLEALKETYPYLK